jgi:hypothetical protein
VRGRIDGIENVTGGAAATRPQPTGINSQHNLIRRWFRQRV